jgi:tetratricopeptide (TPR) repeat protein
MFCPAISTPAPAVTPPTDLSAQNQAIYDRLKLLLSLNLRRQILLAVCDDLVLRDRLVAQLESELAYPAMPLGGDRPTQDYPDDYPRLVSLALDLNDPNPIVQIAQWLTDFPPPAGTDLTQVMPAFQITGVETLTRQPAPVQRLFFSYLDGIERSLPMVEFSVLLWMPRPWFNALKESAPDFWRCRTAVFEFVGDPTPLLHRETEPQSAPPRPQLAATAPQPSPDDPLAQISQSELLAILNHDLSRRDSQPDATGRSSPTDSLSSSTGAPELALSLSQPHQESTPDPAREPNSSESAQTAVVQVSLTHGLATQTVAGAVKTSTIPRLVPTADPQQQEILDFETVTDPAVLKRHIAQLHQQESASGRLTHAYRTLGNLYRSRVEQGIAATADLQEAIAAYEQSLVWLPETSSLWVDILNDLGNLYWMLSRRSPQVDEALKQLEKAIQTYQAGLTRVQLPTQLSNYTMLQNNLGAAYSDLARFADPTDCLQKSIQAYQQALRYRSPEADPLRYALTQNNLGTAYWNLAQHYQPKESLKQAVSAYSEALRYYRPETEPLNHAMIQNNLGTAYWNLAQYERPQDWLTLALGAYRMALRYRTLERTPAAYAATQNNLGTAYWHMANHCKTNTEARLDYLRQAIAAYRQTLLAVDQLVQQPQSTTAPILNFDVYATHNNLALAHYQLATDYQIPFQDGDRLNHLGIALEEHLQAWQGWESQPELQQTTLGCIARTIRGFYNQGGVKAQNLALSKVPGHLLPEILPQL